MHFTEVGKVISLFISTKETKETIQKDALNVDEKGIIDDRHYNKDIMRSVLITSIDSYAIVSKNNICMDHGSLGENLLIDYNPYHLPIGSKLQIGSAVLEIAQPCTLCNHLSAIDKSVPKLLKNDRGVFARVIKTGKIVKDDKIYLID